MPEAGNRSVSEANAGPPRPLLLCILDGWGYREEEAFNAIRQAPTPHYDRLWQTAPRALLETAGGAVGLPDGQMGNSEVGHMNIGGGRIVLQDLPRIDHAIESGALAANPEIACLVDALKATGGTCHIMGLLSPGGVHSHQDHMAHLGQLLSSRGVPVMFHAFLDGRDTPPRSAGDFIEKFEADIAAFPDTSIGTVTGRYYAMDRDKRWDRVERAYLALVSATGEKAATAGDAVSDAYGRDENDEFVTPTIIGGYAGMKDGDAILMANFRADRAREILAALCDPAFTGFERASRPDFCARLGMVEYSEDLNAWLRALFPAEPVEKCLGQVVANAGLKQLRIAETEKYAHVTFFLNGGEEQPFAGEDRILIPSPKVATYDLQPEMSAAEVTDRLVEAIGSGAYDLIVANYANPDMVGHTGIWDAALKAVATIDTCLGRLDKAIAGAGGVMLITADHGNIEMMADPASGQAHTAHTIGAVPLLLVNAGDVALADGRLADLAPTILGLMGLPQPVEMTGSNLLNAGASVQGDADHARATA